MSSMPKIILIPEMGILSGEALSSKKRNADSFGHEMQTALVPPLSYTAACMEAHGRSVPKDDLGGDLMDLVANSDQVTAYVADVSGHGFRAGVLMGMLKTAVRYGLLLGQPLTKLLDDLNRLLPAVKEQHMFATLAALCFDGSGVAEYVSAGHVPLLHYRRSTRDVVRYSVPQLPLGLLAGDAYTSTNIPYKPGDIFALMSDGVLERGEDPDQQAALDRIAKLLRNNADAELCDLVEIIRADTGSCGIQQDDETVLLLKVRDENAADPQQQSSNPKREFRKATIVLESTWQRLLDELAEELSHE